MDWVIKRNLMHIAVGIVIIILYVLLGKGYSSALFFAIFVLGTISQSMIRGNYRIPILEKVLKEVEKDVEYKDWRGLGAQMMVLGSLITVFFFPETVIIPTLLVLTFSDAIASMVGRKIGSLTIIEGKTWIGSIAFFVTTFVIINLFFGIGAGIIVGLIAALAELFPLPDDNVWVPLATALALTAFMPFV